MIRPKAPVPGWLAPWLEKQRWFGGKHTPIATIAVNELPVGAPLWLVTVNGEQGRADYLVLPRSDHEAGEWLENAAGRLAWWELLVTGTAGFEAVAPLPAVASGRLLGAEQTNTSLLYSDAIGAPRAICKLIRRVHPGENPDCEIPLALAQHTEFRHVPPVLGRVHFPLDNGDCTVAVFTRFVPNQGDGWQYALGELRAGRGGLLVAEMGHLGTRTAELHLALAGIKNDPDFAPEPIAEADLAVWRARARAGAELPVLAPYAVELAPWRRHLASADSLAACFGTAKIRIHGDYHLGQTLITEEGFVIFDFEGEPARPLAQRRRKGAVLQDVAGMLRSFHYAALTAAQPAWEAAAREAFLDSYRQTVRQSSTPLAPSDDVQFAAVLRFFETEKLVYELAYELHHRPDWVSVPLSALRRLAAL